MKVCKKIVAKFNIFFISFTQRSSGDKLPASTLAQATASVALSQIVPILISNDSSRILPCIRLLLSRLPGSKEESPVLQFHAGLGLGMFLARIFEEHFSDVCGSQVGFSYLSIFMARIF